jgi:Fe-Mn family superoxide dismutase
MATLSRVLSIGERATFSPQQFEFNGVHGLSRKALDLHLGLYAGYVKQVNGLQGQIVNLARKSQLSDVELLQKDGLVRRLAFEFNGMILHEKFFEQLNGHRAESAPSPSSTLSEAMDLSFGGFEGWRNDVLQLAETRGVGWVVSARHETSNRLTNFWVSEHHLGLPAGMRLIAVFDLWEHAYMLDFAPAERHNYLAVLFNNLDWSVIEARCP